MGEPASVSGQSAGASSISGANPPPAPPSASAPELKVELFVFFALRLGWVLDNGLFAVNHVLKQLVRQHAFHRFTFVAFGDLLNRIRDNIGLKYKVILKFGVI